MNEQTYKEKAIGFVKEIGPEKSAEIIKSMIETIKIKGDIAKNVSNLLKKSMESFDKSEIQKAIKIACHALDVISKSDTSEEIKGNLIILAMEELSKGQKKA